MLGVCCLLFAVCCPSRLYNTNIALLGIWAASGSTEPDTPMSHTQGAHPKPQAQTTLNPTQRHPNMPDSVLWRGTLCHPVTCRTFLLKSCSVSHIQTLKKHKKTPIFMQISCDAIEFNLSTNLKTDSSHLNKFNLI